MEITYLQYLRDNPVKQGLTKDFPIESISLQEIEQLEEMYNNGNPFPKALKELLFLAGNFCYVLDYGIWDTQQELQDAVREKMADENRIISRPFYVVDTYNSGDHFIFIYLDEGDNPPTFVGHYRDRDDRPNWITPITPTLSKLINDGIDRVKQGRNPF